MKLIQITGLNKVLFIKSFHKHHNNLMFLSFIFYLTNYGKGNRKPHNPISG